MNNAVFRKKMENVRKHRDNKLVTIERRKNYLVWEPNYHTTKLFTENLLTIEIKETDILMNKLVYLGVSILELSKILMYEVLVWFCKSNIWWKSKILLYGYRKTHFIHKNKWYY